MKNWDEQIEFPLKPHDVEYAYVNKYDNTTVKCTKDELNIAIAETDAVLYAATPMHDNFIIPGSDYETLQPLLKKRMKALKFDVYYIGILSFIFIICVLWIGVYKKSDDWLNKNDKVTFLIICFIPFIKRIYEIFTVKRINGSNYEDEAKEYKFNFWLMQKDCIPVIIIIFIFVVLGLFQLLDGIKSSILSAGLVKANTFSGEYWRLLTGTMLHASIGHSMLNAFAIFVLGRLIIRTTNFSYFALVFLFSALLGSVCSLLLLPETTSVGSSGGIMGIIGFLLVLSCRFKGNIPLNYLKWLVSIIVSVAILGLLASEVIDNAAHAGGFIAGLFLGLILIKNRENVIPYKPNMLINILGVISTIILGIGIILTISKIY